MKIKKCILCKKGEVEFSKPFCLDCYKNADVFAKIKAFKETGMYKNPHYFKSNHNRIKKHDSRYMRDKFQQEGEIDAKQ